MRLRRAIAISLAGHAALLITAHLRFDPTAADLHLAASTEALASRFVHVQTERPPPTLPSRAKRDHTKIVEMDLQRGLDGTIEESEQQETKEKNRSESSEPATTAPSESRPKTEETERSSGAERPDSREVEKADRAVDEETTSPTPVVTSDSESEVEARATEGRASGDGTKTGTDLGSSGSGAGQHAGGSGDSGETAQNAAGTSNSGVDRGALIRGYTRKLYRRLARHKHYPRAARRAGLEGEVVVEIRIDARGQILSVELVDSSGHETLDHAALKAVRELDKFPAPPGALAWDEKRLQVPIRYDLDKRG